MPKVHLLFGTESGGSELLCEDIEKAISENIDCEVSSMEDVSPSELNADTFYIFVSSTFGTGELPATAQSFFDEMVKGKPDLSGITFAIFGLGDTNFYDTFGRGSEQIMTELKNCGATMVGERIVFDASSDGYPEDIAIPWAKNVLSNAPDRFEIPKF
ncbi:MAG: flavodoxin domain-containing protein [Pseudomonadota bacterium]